LTPLYIGIQDVSIAECAFRAIHGGGEPLQFFTMKVGDDPLPRTRVEADQDFLASMEATQVPPLAVDRNHSSRTGSAVEGQVGQETVNLR